MLQDRHFRYIFRIAPASFVFMAAMGLLNGLVGVLGTYATERLFSEIEQFHISLIYESLLLYGVLLILSELYVVWYMHYHVQFHSVLRFEAKVRTILHRKSSAISNEQLESPYVFSQIKRAEGCRHHLFRYAQIRIELVTMLCSAGLITGYISAMNIWFLVVLPIAIIPIALRSLVKSNILDRNYYRLLALKKQEKEFVRILSDERYISENRISGADSILIGKYMSIRTARLKMEEEQSRVQLKINIATSIFECLGLVGGFLISVLLYRRHLISVAELTAGVAAYSFLSSMVKAVSSSIANGAIYRKMISPYFEYIALQERPGRETGISFDKSIELRNVSFRYPVNDETSIENVNLHIDKGEVIAIVGENGSGKTTLVNVILGLYEPSTGCVLYDDKDISLFKEPDVHLRQSTVSQNFIRYKLSVKDNIRIGSFSKCDDKYIEEGIRSCLSAKVSGDTMLGKEFGGVELSGGEWQRLAILRGFYKDSDIVVLDEPTSAIDPLKEKALYDEFHEKLKGKTGIIITHRLASIALADRIIVMKDGHIIESGTHEKLLSISGEYTKLWNAQYSMFN